MKKIAALALFSALIGCKQEASNPLTKVHLMQPDLVSSKCYRYEYQKGRWQLKDELPLADCDLIFGVNWADYEKLMRDIKRYCASGG